MEPAAAAPLADPPGWAVEVLAVLLQLRAALARLDAEVGPALKALPPAVRARLNSAALSAVAGRELEAGHFWDVEPDRLYCVRELVELRGGARQSYYKAMTCGRLKETVSAGRRMVRGSDFMAFLQKRALERPGSAAAGRPRVGRG